MQRLSLQLCLESVCPWTKVSIVIWIFQEAQYQLENLSLHPLRHLPAGIWFEKSDICVPGNIFWNVKALELIHFMNYWAQIGCLVQSSHKHSKAAPQDWASSGDFGNIGNWERFIQILNKLNKSERNKTLLMNIELKIETLEFSNSFNSFDKFWPVGEMFENMEIELSCKILLWEFVF